MRRATRALLCALALRSAAPKPPKRAKATGRNESYAVVLYGHGGYVAGALVLGHVLRRVDGTRRRTALVANVSASARAALAADGLYDVRHAAALARHAAGPGVWPGRMLDLWALPFERVLKLDLDLMLLPGAGPAQHLRRLWDAPVGGGPNASALAAVRTSHPGHGRCFNGGMLLLRPSRDTYAEIARAVEAQDVSEDCTVGHDQPVMNKVFAGRWRPLEPWTPVKATMRCAHIPDAPDAFHFFSSTAPWSHQCARCVAAGAPCSRFRGPAKERKNIEACMRPRLLDAQRRWWRELLELPYARPRLFYISRSGPPSAVAAVAARRHATTPRRYDARSRVDEFLEFDAAPACSPDSATPPDLEQKTAGEDISV